MGLLKDNVKALISSCVKVCYEKDMDMKYCGVTLAEEVNIQKGVCSHIIAQQ